MVGSVEGSTVGAAVGSVVGSRMLVNCKLIKVNYIFIALSSLFFKA